MHKSDCQNVHNYKANTNLSGLGLHVLCAKICLSIFLSELFYHSWEQNTFPL